MVRNLSYLVILAIGIYIAVRRMKNRDSENRDSANWGADEDSVVDHWRCSQCQESVPETFLKCWSCGNAREPAVNQNVRDSNEGQDGKK
jgi:hypothetical protein